MRRPVAHFLALIGLASTGRLSEWEDFLLELYDESMTPVEAQLLDEHLAGQHRTIRRQGCRLCHAAERLLPLEGPQLAPAATLRWDPRRNGFVRSQDEEPAP